VVDLIAAVPWPVWVLAPALVVLGWLWASVRCAPLDTELWPGGEYGISGPLLDDAAWPDDEDDGQNDEAEPPLVPGWGEERW